MSTIRRISSQVLFVVLVLFLIYRAWSPALMHSDAQPDAGGDSDRQLVEDKILNFQTRLALGFHRIIQGHQEYVRKEYGSPRALEHMLIQEQVLKGEDEKKAETAGACLRLARLFTIAWHFELFSEAKSLMGRIHAQCLTPRTLLDENIARPLSEAASVRDLRLGQGASEQGEVRLDISEAEDTFLRSKLGLWADVFLASVHGDEALRKQAEARAYAGSEALAWKALVLLSVVGLGFFLCILSFLCLIGMRLVGRLPSNPVPMQIPPALVLEMFCLYLLGMILMPEIFGLLMAWGVQLDRYAASAVGILCLLFVLFWPLLNGQGVAASFSSIALGRPRFRDFLVEPILGFLGYLGGWFPLMLLLLLYSALLEAIHISVQSGVHPVVPVILDPEQGARVIPLMIFLTVVVAPLVEEILFRGALYGWMRSRWGALTSIVLSSFIFASIHPQGLVGTIPLMGIGMVLASIREWRGGLVGCMIAHALFNGGTMAVILIFLL